ncbi:hypothetical protein [Nocardioides marmorisolisilvae]|nr:hypothetical protein [Nocardioides marmorisolisilvae]
MTSPVTIDAITAVALAMVPARLTFRRPVFSLMEELYALNVRFDQFGPE